MKNFADFHARFRARLRVLRQARHLRQQDMERFGIPLRTYQQIELGTAEPRLSTIVRIADAFGIDPGELLQVQDTDPEAAAVGRGGYRPGGVPASTARTSPPQKRHRTAARR